MITNNGIPVEQLSQPEHRFILTDNNKIQIQVTENEVMELMGTSQNDLQGRRFIVDALSCGGVFFPALKKESDTLKLISERTHDIRKSKSMFRWVFSKINRGVKSD